MYVTYMYMNIYVHKYVKTKLKYGNFQFFVNGLFPHLSGGNLVNSLNPGSRSDSCWWRCHLVEAVIPPVLQRGSWYYYRCFILWIKLLRDTPLLSWRYWKVWLRWFQQVLLFVLLKLNSLMYTVFWAIVAYVCLLFANVTYMVESVKN